ncbi:MAG: 2,3,4,5-tetrahydropyridine-2,6-dicarboxylate N-succinyltransferase [Coxiellaceae bacterium]|nr:2,3,4,5-tetrahydropyridine-2,6-dicarboxylate N-succinyltransferase [Coxiellaceae bacterium]
MQTFDQLKPEIEAIYQQLQTDSTYEIKQADRLAIEEAVRGLNQGRWRIAEKVDGKWVTNAWLKEAILLYFRSHPNQLMDSGVTRYFDKVPSKFGVTTEEEFVEAGFRVVPPAMVRMGAFIGKKCVLMPSYVNIGAYIDEGTMVDTWATVGSCAQIGKNVHLSGGVGIGGVLEPLQATPTIIEDDCFIGARSEVVEGVIVGEGSVLAMGVFISQSTPIYNRETKQTSYGHVPPYSVVVPGSLPAKDGSHSLAAAIIVKQVDAKTRAKTSLNDLLRECVQ